MGISIKTSSFTTEKQIIREYPKAAFMDVKVVKNNLGKIEACVYSTVVRNLIEKELSL